MEKQRHRLTNTLLPAGLLTLLWGAPLYAGEGSSQSISWFMIILGLLGGLAFFLYGMEKMSQGMKRTAGNRMRAILATLTRNRLIAFALGGFVTMVIQSSSATTVMLVSFVQAELMSFTQSLGVILGANIGTTITAQMVAFKLTDSAMAMIVIGFGMRLLGKSDQVKSMGDILLGFGMLFYGMKLMSDTMKPLRTYPEFLEIMKGLENPVLGILAGTAFTALVQSSSATTGVVIVLAQQGLISLEAGIPVILGANVGTCVTAGLASIGTSREAKRVALAHTLFNIGGALLFLLWIPQLGDMVRSIARVFDSGLARQIANAHTIFNVTVGLLFLPFVDFFARLILRILPDRPKEKALIPVAWHLDFSLIKTPAIALQLARSEIARMAKILKRMHQVSIVPFISCDLHQDQYFPEQLTLIQGIEMRENKIDFLEGQTRRYLLEISQQELAEGQGVEVNGLISILDTMERIGDIISNQIVPLAIKKQEAGLNFSEEGTKELTLYHEKVGKQLSRLEEVMTNMDCSLARKVRKKKSRYANYDSLLRRHHMQRMLTMKEESVETHSIHMELMDALNLINVYSSEIARNFLQCEALAGQKKEEIEETASA
ncbi:MAG: Na/Pi cotransporter family protein [Thermodesulfobacteriota bacterium]